jgi:hypothetical protein
MNKPIWTTLVMIHVSIFAPFRSSHPVLSRVRFSSVWLSERDVPVLIIRVFALRKQGLQQQKPTEHHQAAFTSLSRETRRNGLIALVKQDSPATYTTM